MPITVQIDATENTVILKISDQFDYSMHQDFRESYRHENEQGIVFRIDLSNTTYMDSSALGMILLLKEHTDKLGGKVIIEKPNDSVSKILSIAKFESFVTIEH